MLRFYFLNKKWHEVFERIKKKIKTALQMSGNQLRMIATILSLTRD